MYNTSYSTVMGTYSNMVLLKSVTWLHDLKRNCRHLVYRDTIWKFRSPYYYYCIYCYFVPINWYQPVCYENSRPIYRKCIIILYYKIMEEKYFIKGRDPIYRYNQYRRMHSFSPSCKCVYFLIHVRRVIRSTNCLSKARDFW